MGSSNPTSETLFDPIRKKWVAKTPEESIRQLLVRHMVEKLGYPKSLIAIEKELSQLPNWHLKAASADQIPKRRADIIAFAKNGDGSLSPLLLIECKATPLSPKFAQQVIGYNAFVGAAYVAIANQTQVLTGSFNPDAGLYQFNQGLPPFSDLS